jgi:hypothetical protein
VTVDLTSAWMDDLFPFRTPDAFRTLVDLAWEDETSQPRPGRSSSSLRAVLADCMFTLTVFPALPGDRDEPSDPDRVMAYLAPPEFVTFGDLGFDLIRVGYVMPAPELGWTDYPVAQKWPGNDGVIQLGANTRSGLEFLISRSLRWFRDEPGWMQEVIDKGREALGRLAEALAIEPDPDLGVETRDPCSFDVPSGWRHEESDDGIGVLAPEAAFADRDPVVADFDEPLEPVLDDATRLLDAGYPASALVGLKDTFYYSAERFLELKPLWARAYRDLGRPQLAEALDSYERQWHD